MGSANIIIATSNWHAFDQSSVGERWCGQCAWYGFHCGSVGVDNCF